MIPAVGVGQQATPAANQGPVTYAKNVALILQRSCQQCHRPGSVAPMSLLTYEETRPWARAIKQRVAQREMPPWFIYKNVGIQEFTDDPSLSDAEIATIAKWVDAGAPQGNPGDLPAPRQFDDFATWTIGQPDLVVWSSPYAVPAVGPDSWPDLYADAGLTEDRYIKAIEVKPDTAQGLRVLHHAHQYMVPADTDQNSAWLAENEHVNLNEYSVGKNADLFPEGAGRLIHAGDKIRFNAHLHSVGEEVNIRIGVGFKFYPKGVVPKHAVNLDGVGSTTEGLDIPAGQVVRQDGYKLFRTPVKITGFQPHMHYRGKGGCLEAIYPSGEKEMLNCAGFNLGWGIMYNYAEESAPLLPAYTTLHVINWHDNTSANRGNPDSKNWTGNGNRTIDEMSHTWTNWYALTEEEYQAEVAARQARRQQRTNKNN
jgi:mono/diheme cytochrome c family protein